MTVEEPLKRARHQTQTISVNLPNFTSWHQVLRTSLKRHMIQMRTRCIFSRASSVSIADQRIDSVTPKRKWKKELKHAAAPCKCQTGNTRLRCLIGNIVTLFFFLSVLLKKLDPLIFNTSWQIWVERQSQKLLWWNSKLFRSDWNTTWAANTKSAKLYQFLGQSEYFVMVPNGGSKPVAILSISRLALRIH